MHCDCTQCLNGCVCILGSFLICYSKNRRKFCRFFAFEHEMRRKEKTKKTDMAMQDPFDPYRNT